MPDPTDNQAPQPTTSDVPNQIPTPDQSSAQPQPQPSTPLAAALQPNVTPDQAQNQPPQNQAPQNQPPQPQPDPRDSHPAVQHASILHRVAETIAGGPRIKTTYDPVTGEATREKIPLTNSQILTGALANVLGGLSQMSGAALAARQHRAPPPQQPLPTQAAQQQQVQQSQEDFERQQQTKVQQAKILTANLENHRLSFALRHEANDVLDSNIALHKDDLENYNKAGVVEASQVPSSQLLKRGYDTSKYIAIPDGHAPAIGPNGQQVIGKDGAPVDELTYSVVPGTTQIPLTQDDYSKFRKYNLMKGKDDFTVPEGATVTGSTQALMNYKVGLFQQTENEVNKVREAAGLQPIDMASELKKNPGLQKSIELYHNDGLSQEPGDQIKSIQRPHPNAAGMMLNLMGGQDALDKYAAGKQVAPDKMDLNSARQIIADPRTDKTTNNGPGKPVGSPAYQAAVNFLASAKQDKDESADEAEARREQNEQKKQDLKDQGTMGYVETSDGKLTYASKKDANDPTKGYSAQTFQEVKPSDLAKDRAVIRPLSDVQMNLSDYRRATNDYDAAVKGGRVSATQASNDKANLTTIFSAPAVTDAAAAHAGAGGVGISVPTLAADLQAGLAQKVTNAYNNLSPEGKAMADNYARSRGAIPAWVKALTNSGRGSKEQLEIELQNLLPPYYNVSDIHNRLDGFQANLDNQKNTLPQNLVGKQIPDPIQRTDKGPQQNARPNQQQQQKPAPAPEGTIVNTANGQMIKQGGNWVAYKGGQ